MTNQSDEGQTGSQVIEKLKIPPLPEDTKNIDGHLGNLCSNCSGLGYTILITNGSKLECVRCDKTGIEPVSYQDLERQVKELNDRIALIINQLLAEGVITTFPKKRITKSGE